MRPPVYCPATRGARQNRLRECNRVPNLWACQFGGRSGVWVHVPPPQPRRDLCRKRMMWPYPSPVRIVNTSRRLRPNYAMLVYRCSMIRSSALNFGARILSTISRKLPETVSLCGDVHLETLRGEGVDDTRATTCSSTCASRQRGIHTSCALRRHRGPGDDHNVGHVDLRSTTPAELVGLILTKLGRQIDRRGADGAAVKCAYHDPSLQHPVRIAMRLCRCITFPLPISYPVKKTAGSLRAGKVIQVPPLAHQF